MRTEIVCALITLAGTILSSIIAWRVSHYAANKEIEKLRLMWQREDIVSSDDEFSKMVVSVSLFSQTQNESDWNTAIETVAAIRAKENGKFARKLDRLYFQVRSGNSGNIESCLSEVIEEKRKQQCEKKISK